MRNGHLCCDGGRAWQVFKGMPIMSNHWNTFGLTFVLLLYTCGEDVCQEWLHGEAPTQDARIGIHEEITITLKEKKNML